MAGEKTTGLTAIGTVDPDNDLIPVVDVSDLTSSPAGTTKNTTPNNLGETLTAGYSGRSGFKFSSPDVEPTIGAALVVTAGSLFDWDLGWTDRTPLIDPELSATNDDQYLSPVGWKDITDVLEIIRTNDVYMGDNSVVPTMTGTRGIVIRGAGTGVGDYGSLVLGGSSSGGSLCGEVKFSSGVERFARIIGKTSIAASIGSEPTTGIGELLFYSRLNGFEIQGFKLSGHTLTIGNTTGPAADVVAQHYNFGGVTLPFTAYNGGTSTGGTGYGFKGCGTGGTILSTGNIVVRKTAVTATQSTADLIISLANNSATPTEAARFKPDGKLALVGNQIGIAVAQTPASSAAAGTTGTICWDGSFLYVCTGASTWKRIAIATW